MKNNGLQIFTICLFILVVILAVALGFMYNGDAERTAKANEAATRAKDAEAKEREAKLNLITLKQLIGHKDDTDIPTIQQSFENDMMRYAKTVEAAEKTYRGALANLSAELVHKNEEHKKTQDSLLELQANFDNLNSLYDTVVKKSAADKEAAIKDLAQARKDFEATQAKFREEVAVAVAEKLKTEQDADAKVKAANTKADEKEMESRLVAKVNDELSSTLDDLRKDNFDSPHGVVLSVSQQMSTVVINLGSADGLRPRMTFSVYPPHITGISFGNTDPNVENTICEVCKRDRLLNASKASVEITKILGPHKAEGRILDDQLINPIVAGDVVYTPIWKPGQLQHFALASGMRISGIGRRDGDPSQSDLEEIKRLITANGGVVDCYISEGNDEGKKRGELVGAIDQNTTFLVMGAPSDEDNQDQTVMETQSQMKKTAEQYAVKRISLQDLLTRMGWKNTTPVRGFDKYAVESDIQIKPTGENRPSTGLVSPLYQGRNEKARVSNEERIAGIRPSVGTTSGLYSGAPSTALSPGKTSDLFRTRKPAVDRVETQTE